MNNHQTIKIILAWLFVAVPLLWGVIQVVVKTMAIFL